MIPFRQYSIQDAYLGVKKTKKLEKQGHDYQELGVTSGEVGGHGQVGCMWRTSVRFYFIDMGDSYPVFGFGFKIHVFVIHFICILYFIILKEKAQKSKKHCL